MTMPVMGVARTATIATILTTIGPLSMALYTPVMPTLVAAFDTTDAIITMTLTAYFAGFAFTQLATGPFADALGRRRSTILFIAIYIAGSLAAALAPSVEILVIARLVQGIGSAMGTTVSRAIVRDLYPGETGARVLNLVGIALASAPALAPTIGGFTAEQFGWHAIFVLMVVYGVMIGMVAVFGLKETISPDMSKLHPRNVARAYATLVTNQEFLMASLCVATGLGLFFGLATLLPFVMIDVVGLTPTQFGFSMLFQSGTFMLGSLSMRVLLRWRTVSQMVVPGLGFMFAGSVAMAIAPHALGPSLKTIMFPVALYAFGVALIMPHLLMASMRPFPRIAGQASSLTGFIQMGSGFVAGMVGAWISDPIWAITTIMPAMGAISIGAYLFYRRAAVIAERLEPEGEAAPVAPALAE